MSAGLQVVDAATGELRDHHCAHCQELQDQLEGADREIKAWRSRYAELRRDRAKEAKDNPLWPRALALFRYWKGECNHPRASWSADRFEIAEPFLRMDGFDLCKRAIDGAAFDPYVTERKNGSQKRHDGWDLIFRDRSKFEEFANRAPLPDKDSVTPSEPDKEEPEWQPQQQCTIFPPS